MARSERERSPPRGDRRPLTTQRREAELMGLSGDARERATALPKRDKTIPRPPVTVAATSSSGKPPPPPGAGAIKKKVAMYDIAKTPRPERVTRPLAPQTQISGKKRKAEDDGGVRGRPPQPRPAPAVPRGSKRPGAPLSRPADLRSRPVRPLKSRRPRKSSPHPQGIRRNLRPGGSRVLTLGGRRSRVEVSSNFMGTQ